MTSGYMLMVLVYFVLLHLAVGRRYVAAELTCRPWCDAAGLRPPVIHRDIKPENVVLEGGQWGGRVFLIDFGGVQGSAGIGESGEVVVRLGSQHVAQSRGAVQRCCSRTCMTLVM